MIFVHALGTARIDAGNLSITPNSARRFAALLYLAAERGRRVPRSTMQELLWADRSTKRALHSLRELIYKLRQAGVELDSDMHGVELTTQDIWADYQHLIECDALDLERLQAAQGGLLPGYAPSHSTAFSEWYEAYRAKTTADVCRSILSGLNRAKLGGDWLLTERAARACLACDPMNEDATLGLAEALAMTGSRAQAIKLLDSYADSVGVESATLRVPAGVLRRKIAEQPPREYRKRREMPFVGRQSEMSQLSQWWTCAQTTQSLAVLLTGDPGIGKTRLAEEFTTIAALRGATVRRCVARPHDVRRPMAAFMDLVPSLVELPGALGCSPRSLKSLSLLTSLNDADTFDRTPHDIQSVSFLIGRGIDDLLEAVTEEAPLVLFFDDAHWLDDHSLVALEEMLVRRKSPRLMVLLASRTEDLFASKDQKSFEQQRLALRPLPADDARRLSMSAFLDVGGALDMSTWICSKADGNPLFIEILGAHYDATQRPFEVPESLLGMVGQRTRAVSPRALAALHACVALGTRCSFDRLTTVLTLPNVELLMALDELETAGLIRATANGLLPAHPLIAETFHSNPTATFRLAHRQVAMALEADPEFSTSPVLLWDCSEHWLAAGDHSRAIASIRSCAAHAIEIGKATEAAHVLRQAVELTNDDSLRCALLVDAVRAARLGSEHPLALRYISELRRLQPGQPHDEIELCELEASCATFSNASTAVARAIDCATHTGVSSEHRVRAALTVLKHGNVTSDPDIAQRIRHVVAESDLAEVGELLRLEYCLVQSSIFGEHEVATTTARQIIARGFSGTPSIRGAALVFNSALALWHAGRVDEALDGFQVAYQLGTDADGVRMRMLAAVQLAGSLFDLDRRDLGKSWLSTAEAIAAESAQAERPIQLSLLQIDVALNATNTKRAKHLLSETDQLDHWSAHRRRGWRRAFGLRLRQLGIGRRVREAEIERLLADRSGLGQPDGLRELQVAIAVFYYADQASRARAIVEDFFVAERRSRAPIGAMLHKALEAAHIDDLVDANEGKPRPVFAATS